jgi:hypothetical protein
MNHNQWGRPHSPKILSIALVKLHVCTGVDVSNFHVYTYTCKMCLYNTSTVHVYMYIALQVTCCECVRSGQMLVSGGSAGVISFWNITNNTTVGYII